MRTKSFFALAAIVGAVSLFTYGARTRGQDAKPPAKTEAAALDEAAMMAEWTKVAAPGEHHKHLDYFVGKWRTTTKMFMGGPGSPAMESEGTSEMTWVLGGRFIMDRSKSEMMGQPQEGIGFTGYDNYRNMYVSSWHSSMGTNILTMTGTRHPKTGVFTYYGEMDEPGLKVVGRTVKYITKITDKDHFVFEIIDLHAGDDFKVIEATYTRQ